MAQVAAAVPMNGAGGAAGHAHSGAPAAAAGAAVQRPKFQKEHVPKLVQLMIDRGVRKDVAEQTANDWVSSGKYMDRLPKLLEGLKHQAEATGGGPGGGGVAAVAPATSSTAVPPAAPAISSTAVAVRASTVSPGREGRGGSLSLVGAGERLLAHHQAWSSQQNIAERRSQFMTQITQVRDLLKEERRHMQIGSTEARGLVQELAGEFEAKPKVKEKLTKLVNSQVQWAKADAAVKEKVTEIRKSQDAHFNAQDEISVQQVEFMTALTDQFHKTQRQIDDLQEFKMNAMATASGIVKDHNRRIDSTASEVRELRDRLDQRDTTTADSARQAQEAAGNRDEVERLQKERAEHLDALKSQEEEVKGLREQLEKSKREQEKLAAQLSTKSEEELQDLTLQIPEHEHDAEVSADGALKERIRKLEEEVSRLSKVDDSNASDCDEEWV